VYVYDRSKLVTVMFVCMCMYVYVCVCVCMYVYVCVCMCMCVYVHIGRDFLPRGNEIVTRRPLILQLIHTEVDKTNKADEKLSGMYVFVCMYVYVMYVCVFGVCMCVCELYL